MVLGGVGSRAVSNYPDNFGDTKGMEDAGEDGVC